MGNYWDWESFGEDIRRTVQDAVDSQDFRRLNQSITDTVNSAVDGLRKNAKRSAERVNRKFEREYRRSSDNTFCGVDLSKLKTPELYVRTGGKKARAMALAIVGYGLGGALALGLIITAITAAVLGNDSGMLVGMGTMGILTAICGAMAAAGTLKLGRIRRFERYVRELQGKNYCNLDELALRVRKSKTLVQKDIIWMLERGWFLQGHLDDQDACLMVSDEAYEVYRDLMEQRKVQQKMQEEQYKEKQSEKKTGQYDSEVQAVIQAGKEYIRKIRECNDAIPGEVVSEKIYRMEMLTKRIFERVAQDPEAVDDIRKMMEYYLPTAVKLLEAYEQLDGQPVQGENIKSSKKEIEDTLDTLNTAFEKLLDDLFQDTAWDVSSDISVLKTMLAQEGLTGKDFETGGKK